MRRPRSPAAAPAYLSRPHALGPLLPGPEVKASPRRPAVKSEAPTQLAVITEAPLGSDLGVELLSLLGVFLGLKVKTR